MIKRGMMKEEILWIKNKINNKLKIYFRIKLFLIYKNNFFLKINKQLFNII